MNRIIKERRACRKFDSAREVEAAKIEEIVQAGLVSPTGMNTQNVLFFVIENKRKRDEYAKMNAAVAGWNRDPFYGAPVVIVVASKKTSLAELDGSAAIMSMLLEATNQGLGTCWIHRAKEVLATEEGRALFAETGLDFNDYVGIGNIALGYPLEATKTTKEIKPGRVFYLK